MSQIDTSGVARPGAFLGQITTAVRDLAAQRLSKTQPGLVLDVGCGNGLFFASLDLPDASLVGVDLDLELLLEARRIFLDNRTGSVQLSLAHAGALPFQEGSFDNILFLNTLINIPTDDAVASLIKELTRICRPGGRVLMDIRNASNPLLRARYWHHNRKADFVTRAYHRRHITNQFESRGFELDGCDRIGPPIPFGALAFLLVMRRRTG